MTVVMMLKNEKPSLPKCCCQQMENALQDNEHPIYYSSAFQEFGIKLSSGYEYVILNYCNWCGSKLPESKRDDWFDSLEKLGINPWEDDIPIHFLSSSWWDRA